MIYDEEQVLDALEKIFVCEDGYMVMPGGAVGIIKPDAETERVLRIQFRENVREALRETIILKIPAPRNPINLRKGEDV